MAAGGPTVNENIELLPAISADAVSLFRKLPRQPVKDLLSNGVCARCILRLFLLHDQIYSHPSMTTSVLSTLLYESMNDDVSIISTEAEDTKTLVSNKQLEEESKPCGVCLGILQYMYKDDKGILVRKDCPNNFIAAIEHVLKQEGHQFDSFSLEVSLPRITDENEQAVRLYIEEKYGSESWFPETRTSGSVSIKDFLKMSVGNLLEKLLGVKSNVTSSFKVRLTYALSDASAKNQLSKETNGFNKRRKTDGNDGLKNQGGYHKVEGDNSITNSLVLKFSGGEEVNQWCSLSIHCHRTSIFVGGRYLKYSRNVSQTRWIIDDERMGEASIEEIVGGNILPVCQGDNYKFHAAGREDIDVRMLGTGRPFLVEIQNARILPSDAVIKDMETIINSLESKLVKVKKLKVLGNQGWDLMREGEAEKQKQYTALVWISRPLEDNDIQTLSSLKDMQILQKTPIRVLHRRSPLEREKTIHWMRIEKVGGSCQYFLLHLCTQAGTYIKEFVHGDLGRTHPSVGSILDCRAEILRLDVTDVKMDWFQE